MTSRLPHDGVRDLLAAYALDAVDDDEAEAIELHLLECPRCRAAVAEHREVASALAAGHKPAPIGVWDNIVAELETAPPMQLASVVPLARPRRRWAVTALAAVAAVALTLVGVGVVAQNNRIDNLQAALDDRTLLAAALSAYGNPDARVAELRSANGRVLARAVLQPDGTGYLQSEALPRATPDRTYQLWAVIGTERISAGVLGPRPTLVPFRIAGEIVGLAITEEVAGGVVASQNQPVATGLIVTS